MEDDMKAIEIGVLHDWQETKLWQELQKNGREEVEDVSTTLKTCMPKIQTVLASSGTALTDFTLHDSQHAFRVAERMVDIIPNGVITKLSTYELTLLLLAAYLHDIGMSPKQEMVSQHRVHLLTGDSATLNNNQIDLFQYWLDDQEEDINIPLVTGTLKKTDLHQANYLIAHYCRARHVEWCDQWIGDNLASMQLGSYVQWSLDLKLLCRSHHLGYVNLLSDKFDPKPVGTLGLIVHLRFLACILRIADILEFDPERTPEIIFQHRGINPGSEIFWHKDKHITMLLENNMVTIAAEPTDARIHRAVEEMANDIAKELRMIRTLNDFKPFQYAYFKDEPLSHRWDILPDVRQNIRPRDNAYEYIDGVFRPDTKKLLHLLSGKELYEDEFIAVRELLQNAFDAVKEQIAYERLERADPSNKKWEQLFGEIYEVELSLEVENNEFWLCCSDNGVGMSKDIIKKYLLISGNSRRKDVRQLERLCLKAGFDLERTGQFGIGVLSYFMLADKVQIYTKRSAKTEDADNIGWYFETNGVGSFGELHQDQFWNGGTKVRLSLSEAFIRSIENSPDFTLYPVEKRDVPDKSDASDHSTRLYEYIFYRLIALINKIIIHLPCKLRISHTLNEKKSITLNQGWIDISEIRQDATMVKSKKRSIPSIPNRFESADVRKTIEECIEWDQLYGELPNGLGKFRINIPVFKLDSGDSHVFCFSNIIGSQRVVKRLKDKVYMHLPEGRIVVSWKGMAVKSTSSFDPLIAYVDINWLNNDAGTLSVSREKFTLSSDGSEALKWLSKYIQDHIINFAKNNDKSPFSTISYALLSSSDTPEKRSNTWLTVEKYNDEQAFWGDIPLPVTTLPYDEDIFIGLGQKLIWKDEIVNQILDIQYSSPSAGSYKKIKWNWQDHPPDMITILEILGLYCPVPIWNQKQVKRVSKKFFGGYLCQYPDNWLEVATFASLFDDDLELWNQDNPICKIENSKAIKEMEKKVFSGHYLQNRGISEFNKIIDEENLLGDIDKAKCFLSNIVGSHIDAIITSQQHLELIQQLWRFIINTEQNIHSDRLIFTPFPLSSSENLYVLTPKSLDKISLFRMTQILPAPGPEWVLFLE